MASMSASDLAKALGTSPPQARRFLRTVMPEGKQGTRWNISKAELADLKARYEQMDHRSRGETPRAVLHNIQHELEVLERMVS